MEQIKLRGSKVAVEKFKKQDKANKSFYIEVGAEEYLGTVRFVAPDAGEDIKVGQRVYFGTQFQTVRIGGAEVCVMEDANVLAIASES